jgi:hypothetical protein
MCSSAGAIVAGGIHQDHTLINRANFPQFGTSTGEGLFPPSAYAEAAQPTERWRARRREPCPPCATPRFDWDFKPFGALGPQPAQAERDLLAASGAAALRALARPSPSESDASALLRAGLLDVEFGRPEQGEPLLRRAEALGSREPALGYALAKCLFRLDRTPEAVALATGWAQRDRRLDRLAARLREVSGDR